MDIFVILFIININVDHTYVDVVFLKDHNDVNGELYLFIILFIFNINIEFNYLNHISFIVFL